MEKKSIDDLIIMINACLYVCNWCTFNCQLKSCSCMLEMPLVLSTKACLISANLERTHWRTASACAVSKSLSSSWIFRRVCNIINLTNYLVNH